jgi:hypothetical protein
MMQKLGFAHRAELVRLALETGLLKAERAPAAPQVSA